jgi:hypothetical protein
LGILKNKYAKFLATFFHGKKFALIECGLGYILGDFFTNSSGHPGEGELCCFVTPMFVEQLKKNYFCPP